MPFLLYKTVGRYIMNHGKETEKNGNTVRGIMYTGNEVCYMDKIYDVIIIGGGPGGYTAALYCARGGLSTLVFEKQAAGGQMALTSQVDNYPGFEEGVDGFILGEKMKQGAERFGVETRREEVSAVKLTEDIKEITAGEETFKSRCVIIAAGAGPRKLGLSGEEEMTGSGISYCAACDGMFFRKKTVAVIGGGNTAAADALILSRICQKVILVHRRDELRAEKIYQEPLFSAENIEFCWNSQVEELLYDEKITGIKIKNKITGEISEKSCDGVFVSVGREPASELFKEQIAVSKEGYIVADETTKTSLPGVFAVGDIRTKEVRQIVTAAADGATSAHFVQEYLAEQTAKQG